jgi:uncharacterized protein with FMN-binding domain
MSSGLVALSSAAVLAIYSAGYLRTRSAAQQFDGEALERRFAAPVAVHAPAATSSQTPTVEASPVANPAPRDLPARAAVSARDQRPADPSSQGPAKPRAASEPRETHATTSSSDTTGDVAATPAPAAASAPVAPLAATSQPGADLIASEGVHRTELPAPPIPKSQYKDGTYTGWGTSRHGDIQASVVIEGGRIISATIAQCLTRYSCSWIAPLLPEVVARQSAEVDYVSGATESTNAFYYGVLEALGKAK